MKLGDIGLFGGVVLTGLSIGWIMTDTDVPPPAVVQSEGATVEDADEEAEEGAPSTMLGWIGAPDADPYSSSTRDEDGEITDLREQAAEAYRAQSMSGVPAMDDPSLSESAPISDPPPSAPTVGQDVQGGLG